MANTIKLPKFRKGDRVRFISPVRGTIIGTFIPKDNDAVFYDIEWEKGFLYPEDELERVDKREEILEQYTIEELEEIVRRRKETDKTE